MQSCLARIAIVYCMAVYVMIEEHTCIGLPYLHIMNRLTGLINRSSPTVTTATYLYFLLQLQH